MADSLALGRRPTGQDVEQLPDALRAGDRVGEREVRVDRVPIAPALSLAGDVAGGAELGHDPVRGAFGDPDSVPDVAQADAGVVGNAEQDPGVIGQERPGGCGVLGHRVEFSVLRLRFLASAFPAGRAAVAEIGYYALQLPRDRWRCGGEPEVAEDKALAQPRSFALNVSNVPGPRRPVSVLGLPALALYSIAEIGERHALRIAGPVAGGHTAVGPVRRSLLPDVDHLAADIEAEAAALLAHDV